MGDIKPLTSLTNPESQPEATAESKAGDSPASAAGGQKPPRSPKTAAGGASGDGMPSIEELLAENRRLQAENKDVKEQAEGWKEQAEQLRNRGPIIAEMTTTTTKPVWAYEVSGSPGVERFDVVDESEAKRLYCVKHKIDPSLFVLNVKCLESEERNASITKQYKDAGADLNRIPGVNLGVENTSGKPRRPKLPVS